MLDAQLLLTGLYVCAGPQDATKCLLSGGEVFCKFTVGPGALATFMTTVGDFMVLITSHADNMAAFHAAYTAVAPYINLDKGNYFMPQVPVRAYHEAVEWPITELLLRRQITVMTELMGIVQAFNLTQAMGVCMWGCWVGRW